MQTQHEQHTDITKNLGALCLLSEQQLRGYVTRVQQLCDLLHASAAVTSDIAQAGAPAAAPDARSAPVPKMTVRDTVRSVLVAARGPLRRKEIIEATARLRGVPVSEALGVSVSEALRPTDDGSIVKIATGVYAAA
jgi:hypothetical protein